MRTNMRDTFTEAQRQAFKPKIVARNTFKYVVNDTVIFRLHNTDIVKDLGNGRFELNSGGWKTVTTKERMNRYLDGYSIYSVKGQWYVRRGVNPYGDGEAIPYYDGMIVPDAFENRSEADKIENANTKLKAKIAKFVAQIQTIETLPLPNGGDCWHCCMFDTDSKGDNEHILNHINENYIHGSLLVNAMRWAGFSDVGIHYYITSPVSDPWRRGRVRKTLNRYLNFRCGLPY